MTIPLVVVVNVGMSVEVENAQVLVLTRERPHDRVRDRMITAQRDRHQPVSDQRVDRVFNQRRHLTARDGLDITGIEEDRITGKIRSILTRQIPRIRPQRRTNLRRRIRRTLRERRIFVIANSDEGKFWALFGIARRLLGHVAIRGAPSRARTCDLLIRSQTLYPTELRVHG